MAFNEILDKKNSYIPIRVVFRGIFNDHKNESLQTISSPIVPITQLQTAITS